mgnify:CR=1 FL=1
MTLTFRVIPCLGVKDCRVARSQRSGEDAQMNGKAVR